MSTSPFNPRVLAWLIGLGVTSLVGGLLLAMVAPEIAPVSTVVPSGFSRSAIGHQALVEVLGALDVPTVLSRHDSAGKVREGSVLVVAEPRLDLESPLADQEDPAHRLQALISRAPATLLVLPKWEGGPNAQAPAWIQEATLVDDDVVQEILDALGIDAQIRRVTLASMGTDPMEGSPHSPHLFAPVVQVIEGADVDPVVHGKAGTLVAGVRGWDAPLLLLADPDPLSNAGLYRAPNGAFALDLIDRLREPGGVVVFDETLHGLEALPSLWTELFRFPLVLVVLQVALVLGVLLWASMGRFGAPQAPPPALEPGTTFLVASTADLLRHGTSAPRALRQYLDVTRRQVASTLNAPTGLAGPALDAWLDRVAARRDVDLRLGDLKAAVAHAEGKPARVRAAAQEVHRWREEILHGSVHHPHAA